MNDVYDLYYEANNKSDENPLVLFKKNLTKEQVDLFLNNLEPALESSLKVIRREMERDER